MRKFRHSILLLIGLAVLFNACQKDDDPGFASRDDYLGLWQCDEYDINQLLIATFQIEIFVHPGDANKVLIDNFNLLGYGFQAEAEIDNTSINIPQQLVSGVAVGGSGFMTNNLTGLDLQYTVDDGSGQPETISALCTKM